MKSRPIPYVSVPQRSQSVARKAKKAPVLLTEARVASLALPKGKSRDTAFDASQEAPRGFCVRFSRKSKVYYLLAAIDGKRSWVRVGDAKTLTLKAARLAAKAKAGEIALGRNPNVEAQRERTDAVLSEWTIDDMLKAYINARPRVSDATAKSRRWLRGKIAKYLSMPARDVVKADVRGAITTIMADGHVTALVTLQLLRTAYRWAMDEEVLVMADGRKIAVPRVDRDPTRGVERDIGLPGYRPRTRYLSDEEIPILWRAVESLGPNKALFCRLIILSGTRNTETKLARWERIDFDGNLWHIPASHRKGRPDGLPGERRHLDVPLSPLAVSLLREHFPLTRERGRVFVSLNPRELGPEITEASGLPRVTIHDLRRTCSTGLQRIKCPPHVISVVLGHKREEGATETDAVYTHDRRLSEHREWLVRWAEHVEGLLR